MMKTISVYFFVFSLFAFSSANAQSLDKEVLSNWKFRYYACKHVVLNSTIVARMIQRHGIQDARGLENLRSQIETAMVEAILQNEEEYSFSSGEAWFVSDVTFSIVSGMLSSGFELTDTQLMSTGNDLCIDTIQAMLE